MKALQRMRVSAPSGIFVVELVVPGEVRNRLVVCFSEKEVKECVVYAAKSGIGYVQWEM